MKPTTAEEARIIRDRDHKGMILNDQLWPHWTVLPVKNPRRKETKENPFNDQGLIYAGNLTTVYLVNLFDRRPITPATPRIEYSSVDTLLADGWIVD